VLGSEIGFRKYLIPCSVIIAGGLGWRWMEEKVFIEERKSKKRWRQMDGMMLEV
jgi:hypothetical protein